MPCAAILLQVCFVYWFTVALKWTPAWLGERTAVAMALDLDYMVTSWGRLLRDYPELLAWLTTATLALEAIGPLLALSPYATGPIRFVVVLVFVEFHLLGLGAAIHLGIFPWVAACAWLLFLPTWLWRRVLRAPDAGETAAAADGRFGAHPLRNAVVGLLLVLVLLLNLVSVWPGRLGWLLPAPLRTASRVLGLNQSWQLFAPSPPSEDGWYVMPGLLESGEVVDVWSGGEVRFDKPADVAANYRGGRWVKLLSNLSMSRFSALRPPFVRWLCRGWNEDAPSGRRLTQVDVYFVIERFETPEAQPEPIFLLGARCLDEAQNTASGLSGEPVPPGTGNGAAVSRKSQRPSRAASSATASRSRLSKIGMPSPTSTSRWTGCETPSTCEGNTSLATSDPSTATPRSRRKRTEEAWSPAERSDTSHGPSAARRAQRPVRTSRASPGPTSIPVCSSQAARSSG